MTTILFNEYIFKLCAQLQVLWKVLIFFFFSNLNHFHYPTQGYYPAAGGDILEASTTVTPNIANVRHSIKKNVTNSQKPTILNLIILYKKAILTILTYTCILYIALQIISLLTVLWWSSNIPFGLVFLMLDLSYMGFIMSKV